MFAHTLSLGIKQIVLLKMLLNTDLPQATASLRAVVSLVLKLQLFVQNKSMFAVLVLPLSSGLHNDTCVCVIK
jgi:hypothetical protein